MPGVTESSVAGLGVGNRLHSEAGPLATGTPSEAETAPSRRIQLIPGARGGAVCRSFLS
jgi:hypothetical protein